MDLNAMARKDLLKLKSDVEKAIASVGDRERRAALDAAEKAAAEHGYSLSDLTGVAGGRGKARKAKGDAKYRNPANPSQTWSGKGRRPDWYKAAEAAGRSASDMLI